MAFSITITSIDSITSTAATINFSSTSEFNSSSWYRRDVVIVPDDGVAVWHHPAVPVGAQWVRLLGLTSSTDYSVIVRGKLNFGDEWENSNSADFSTTSGAPPEDPPGKAKTPTPSDGQEDLKITGKDNLKQLAWVAPAGETPIYSVYFRASGGAWALQETITDDSTTHTLSSDVLTALSYYSIYEWRVDTVGEGGTTTGDTWTFITQRENRPTAYTRRSDYDEDKVWQPGTGWVAPNTFEYTGAGRYKSRVVVIGHQVIYFGDV